MEKLLLIYDVKVYPNRVNFNC